MQTYIFQSFNIIIGVNATDLSEAELELKDIIKTHNHNCNEDSRDKLHYEDFTYQAYAWKSPESCAFFIRTDNTTKPKRRKTLL